ncbi:hypothetical protein [Actinoplanes sp. HUAS TT8]|uniref:hypothetical protein n=1 Tax=Actinoplanes sp. HUAS TT8 TaxID=3447453 RepID=UPI003F51DB01
MQQRARPAGAVRSRWKRTRSAVTAYVILERMNGASSDSGALADQREQQVLRLFDAHRRTLQLRAATRCPHDERLLAGVCRLPDGLWAWHAGSRLAPQASRIEISSWHLDRYAIEEITPELHDEGQQLADELLRTNPRYETPATVLRIDVCADGAIRPGPWRGSRYALQFFAGGLPLLASTTCKCRRSYQVQMLALVHAGVSADLNAMPRTRHVEALPITRVKGPSPVRSAYRFTDQGVQVDLDGP